MNIERLTQIAEWLEAGRPFRHGVSNLNMMGVLCGTSCCIGGAALQWWDAGYVAAYRSGTNHGIDWRGRAGELLGLPNLISAGLMLGFNATTDSLGESMPLCRVTPEWAARCIRKLIATGEVDWRGTEHMPDVRATDQENTRDPVVSGLETKSGDDRLGEEEPAGRESGAGVREVQGLLDRCKRPVGDEAGLVRDVAELDTEVCT